MTPRKVIVMKNFLGLLFVLVLPIPVSAQVNLKSVDTSDGNKIKLQFDRELSPRQVKTEYIRDIIQVSISDATVYPAKIASVDQEPFRKVFTYQYTPKLVRCRINVKGSAENYKGKVTVSTDGKNLVISSSKGGVAPHSDVINVASAQAKDSVTPRLSADEEELLDQVKGKSKVEAKADSGVTNAHFEKKDESPRLTGGKEPPSPVKSFGYLGVIVALLYVGFHMMRRGKKGASGSARSGQKLDLMGAFTKILKKRTQSPSSMIEMVDTYTIDPKKSISIVRVKGRNLVVGVSDQSVNLITELSADRGAEVKESDEDVMKEVDRFEAEFEAQKKDQSTRPAPGVRERIRERVGGLKSL